MLFPVVLDSCDRTQGFGRRVTWTSDLVVPPGHQMTFKDALRIMSTNLIMKIILPDWTKNLTKHSRKVHQSFMELKVGSSNLKHVLVVDVTLIRHTLTSNTCWKWLKPAGL